MTIADAAPPWPPPPTTPPTIEDLDDEAPESPHPTSPAQASTGGDSTLTTTKTTPSSETDMDEVQRIIDRVLKSQEAQLESGRKELEDLKRQTARIAKVCKDYEERDRKSKAQLAEALDPAPPQPPLPPDDSYAAMLQREFANDLDLGDEWNNPHTPLQDPSDYLTDDVDPQSFDYFDYEDFDQDYEDFDQDDSEVMDELPPIEFVFHREADPTPPSPSDSPSPFYAPAIRSRRTLEVLLSRPPHPAFATAKSIARSPYANQPGLSITETTTTLASPPDTNPQSHRHPPDPRTLHHPGTDVRSHRVPPDIDPSGASALLPSTRPGTSALSFRVPPDPLRADSDPPNPVELTKLIAATPWQDNAHVHCPASLGPSLSRPGTDIRRYREPPDKTDSIVPTPSRPGTSVLSFRIPPDPAAATRTPCVTPAGTDCVSFRVPPDPHDPKIENVNSTPTTLIILPGTDPRNHRHPPDPLSGVWFARPFALGFGWL